MGLATLLPFFIVLLVGIVFSELFRKFHLPWVVALVLGGILIGPHALGIFEPDNTINFLAEIGLVFLMFMAGINVSFSSFREIKRKITVFTLLNGGIPFLAGVGVIFYSGYLSGIEYSWETALLMGVIFISSSIAVVIPSIESAGLSQTHLGRIVTSSTVMADIISLIILSVFLQISEPNTSLPLPIFYVFMILILVIMRWLLPKIRWLFSLGDEKDIFQQDLRTIFTILIGTVISFEFLGLHPIVAGFFAGMVLSDYITSDILIGKLRSISYGLFIPIFFIVIGATTNISLLMDISGGLVITILVVLASFSSKIFSGWLGGRLSGFSPRESLLMGAATTPQLSVTLAVAFSASTLGFIGADIVAALVTLTIFTTLLGPIIVNSLLQKVSIAPTNIPKKPEGEIPPGEEKKEEEEAEKFKEEEQEKTKIEKNKAS